MGFEDVCRDFIMYLDPEPDRVGLVGTPRRMAESLKQLTSGYNKTYDDVVGSGVFSEDVNDDIVLVRDIEFYSLCEHHVLPFFGKCHIAYVPDKKIIGLSKLARICDMFSLRLQVQERLTRQICETIMNELKPKGVAVVIEAKHFCMMMRGVGKHEPKTVTSCMKGIFFDDNVARSELMSLLGKLY